MTHNLCINKDQCSRTTSHLESSALQWHWTKYLFRSNSTSFGPPRPQQHHHFSSDLLQFNQTNSIWNKLNTKPHTFSPNSSISSNFKQFQGLLVLLHFKLLQTEIESKSMFVSIRHPTPETRWMGSTGGGTFFYTFSKKISNRRQNLSKNGVPEPP